MKDQVERLLKERMTFTMEAGQGTTYSSQQPTLYAHGKYPRSSVMHGRERRVFVDSWDSWDEARAKIAEVQKELKKFKVEDYGEKGGTTHIPIAQQVAHIPDDTDY